MTDQTASLSETVRKTLKKMRDDGAIDFTNKTDYTAKLRQIASDNNCDYTTVYKQMKKIAKEKGIMVGEANKERKKIGDGKIEFNLSAKKSTLSESKLARQKMELENKKKSLETDLAMQTMIIGSPAFEMMKTSNTYTLLMFRELIKGFNIPVAEETRYEMMGGMLAAEELKNGWNVPTWLSGAMMIAGMAGLFIIPVIPKIREWLSEDKEMKEKKSDEPLAEIENPELKNGIKNETKTTQQ